MGLSLLTMDNNFESVVQAEGQVAWGLFGGGSKDTVSNIGGVMIRGGTVRGNVNINTRVNDVSHVGGTMNLGGYMVY